MLCMLNARQNPLPLSRAQLGALVRCTARQLAWGQRHATEITARWTARAQAIPDSRLRDAAIRSLATKRGHSDGAALFSVLGPRDTTVLNILIVLQLMFDYLDVAHEDAPDERNGRQLNLAFADALDPARRLSEYYRYHPWSDDGGYLLALVRTCRRLCEGLPSFAVVTDLLSAEARRAQVLALNHIPDPAERDAALRRWTAGEFPPERSLRWFELSAAASVTLSIHALLVVAADPHSTTAYALRTHGAYWPWASLTGTMLDSYVDQAEDAAQGNHSYVGHYGAPEVAVERLEECIRRSAEAALRAPDGHRHAVIVACMVAMYLSKDAAWTPEMRATTRRLINAGGSLTRLLVPVLRVWRIYYGHRAC
jgi:tetraprenyl-beta-curcumene synthase